MTEAIREQLSAFVDGELSPVEAELLLKRVERDPALRAALDRYLLLGAGIRSETTGSPSRDFAARVTGALDREQRNANSWVARLRTNRKPLYIALGGGAVAASIVALVMVLAPAATNHLNPEVNLVASEQSSSNNDLPTVIPAAAVRASQLRQQVENSYGNTANNAAMVSQGDNRRLASYVMAHSQYSSPLSRRNVLTGLLVEESDSDPLDAPVKPQLDRAGASSSSDRAMAIR
jgi:sigma-E factor negative regulatory protein RseA